MSDPRGTLAATSATAPPEPADPVKPGGAPAEQPLLQVRALCKQYRLPRRQLLAAAPRVDALQGVSFSLAAGRSLGVVGESGSGKSTLARLVMALERPSAGQLLFDGQDLQALGPAALRRARRGFQMVFQDPFGSLDPRQRVGRIVAEPLAAQHDSSRAQQLAQAQAMLEAVGLRAADASKYPHEFSGGQRQRIAIARALVTGPRLIVADEPVSALDVSVQAQVLNLMQDLQERLGVSYLFISHDLAVVDRVCDEVLVLYQGRVVEQGSPETLFVQAAHPYTRALMAAVPRLGPSAAAARPPRPAAQAGAWALAQSAGAAAHGGGGPGGPSATAQAGAAATGCPFAPRCGHRQADCLTQRPVLRALADAPDGVHRVACHHAEQVQRSDAAEWAA